MRSSTPRKTAAATAATTLSLAAAGALLAGMTMLPAPAEAQAVDPDSIFAFGEVRGLDSLLKQASRDTLPAQIRVSRVNDTWMKAAIPLAPGAFGRGSLAGKAAKDTDLLAPTVDILEPDLFADLISYDLAPLLDTEYHIGFAAVNLGDEDVEKKSTINRKGPGPNLKATDKLVYDANSLLLFWTTDTIEEAGVHTVLVKVTSMGKLKTRICAGCT